MGVMDMAPMCTAVVPTFSRVSDCLAVVCTTTLPNCTTAGMGASEFRVWNVRSEDMLLEKLAFPVYSASRKCDPMPNDEVVNVAFPALNGEVPNVVDPSKKITLPVGVPPAEVTVAVNVTGCGAIDGFGEAVSLVPVADGPQFWAATKKEKPLDLPVLVGSKRVCENAVCMFTQTLGAGG